ncbi:uncharacterized protein CCOS01_16852 [Colletotrichum costaricense]|uniref:Uncharacterized protein n=1 Tax=Colletotrichum costaricense TaxID=1209916 RepID=A0AAJ0DRK9_9PEZI|nr:uncharacterized protein CCOS01_16852 [Colletotrichum costaricense]KAK1504400.1 hypothetical protein CCOS01_16852 [Colletotrichum costaricense]
MEGGMEGRKGQPAAGRNPATQGHSDGTFFRCLRISLLMETTSRVHQNKGWASKPAPDIMPFPVLSKEPIPGLSLSAAGLVALADLQTIANRTALTGTSSWFDALVLAPGLHYQQAADSVAGTSGVVTAQTSAALGYGGAAAGGGGGNGGAGIFGTQALPGGRKKDVKVTNPGMLLFLSRLGVQEERAREKDLKRKKLAGGGGIEAYGTGVVGGGGGSGEKIITLDVGTLSTGRKRSRGRNRRVRAFEHGSEWEFERGSHLLYLASPVLTFAALTIMILLADWWGLASILALITSRLLNIHIIKQRTPSPPPPPPPATAFFASNGNGNGGIAISSLPPKLTEYLIPLTPSLKIRMRGPADDLAALTTDAWLLAKTAVQGYLEATAKLAVYVVAIFSGNVSQAGNLVLLVLLLGSAGLLGLSNGCMKGVRGKGRVARVWHGDDGDGPGGGRGDGAGSGGRAGRGEMGRTTRPRGGWKGDKEEGDGIGDPDWDSQVGRVVRDPYPFEGSVEYS